MVYSNPSRSAHMAKHSSYEQESQEIEDRHYREFLSNRLDSTREYLSRFSGIIKFLTEHSIIPNRKYHGAKRALEEMTEKQEE